MSVLVRIRSILAASALLLLPLSLCAEPTRIDTVCYRYGAYVQWCSPEKLYVHLDRTCYTAGEMLWFKGWLRNAATGSVQPSSRYMYAEVLDAKGSAVCRVKVKAGPDGFPGYIELPWTLETGFYTFRAYTLWQLNGQPGYLFHQRIRIIGEKKQRIRIPKRSPEDIRLAFCPESGRYFAGVHCVMAVKATDRVGRSVDFSGRVVGAEGDIVTLFSTRHDGMGAFEFTPEREKAYFVETASGKRFPLPPAAAEGAVIRLRRIAGSAYISVAGLGGGQASLLLRDAGTMVPLANIKCNGEVQTLRVENDFFRPGINHLLVVDEHGIILAERLFYVYDAEMPLCTVDPHPFSAQPRALVEGHILLRDRDGNPLDGNCSVSVVRGTLKDWQQTDGILSYMGLSSELSGSINDPCWYFDETVPLSERTSAMDLLMLVQGWRYYDLDRIFDPADGKIVLRHTKELTQTVRGRIRRRLSGKMPKKFSFSLLIPKLKYYTTLDVDQADSYVIDSIDFEENTGFVIKIGRSRVGLNYIPRWEGDILAPPFVYPFPRGYAVDGRGGFDISLGGTSTDTLQAAVVIADAGQSDILSVDGTRSEDLSHYKTMTLIEYLRMKKASFEYDGDHMVNRSGLAGHSYAQETDEEGFPVETFEAPRGAVKLLVNGTEEPWWGYDMVLVEDIRSIEIANNAVAISLKPGTGSRDTYRDPSLRYFVPLGYQVPQYFESPRYDRGENQMHDSRNTVWWSPSLPIEHGKAGFAFCNTDLQDYPYIVRIEGLTSDGRPFSRHCVLNPRN